MIITRKLLRAITALVLSLVSAVAENSAMQHDLEKLAVHFDGQIGICAVEVNDTKPLCINSEAFFPLQSVMKLIVAAAVMDAVDRQEFMLSEEMIVKPGDASPGPQEFAGLVKSRGIYKATIEELVRRSVIDSDSTSVDLLIARLGGIPAIQAFLKRKNIPGIRVDRNERDLQSESAALLWQAEYADDAKFEAAVAAVPVEKRTDVWERHLKDPRDKATPTGMMFFLNAFASGKLLSTVSTEKLLAIMGETATGHDRLRAGVSPGWEVAHKTGTGRVWNGVTEATNDVGILIAPDNRKIAVAVFLAQSRDSAERQAAVIAQVASILTGNEKYLIR